VNICGLFRRPAEQTTPSAQIFEWLGGPDGSYLRKRWESAEVDESSRCAVAGLSLTPQRATELSELCIGDSVTMIPPVTGNGMSMAFESAALAVEPVHEFSRGRINWTEARRLVAALCDRGFRRRLQWASAVQRLLFLPATRAMLVRIVPGQLWLWQLLFSRTR
jgi:flavin-dependent dehydrogenase